MKKIFTKKVRLQLVFACLVFGALALFALSPKQNPTITKVPITVETSADNPTPQKPTKPSATKPSAKKSISKSSTAKPQAKKQIQSSSKQAKIAATVATEHRYHALQLPNDPMYGTFVDGNNVTHTPFALQHIGAPAVWDRTTGTGVVIADIDTGFALNHEDLSSQWYQNAGETGVTQPGDDCWTGTPENKSTNNCDDDSNGYEDDWRGWNFTGSYVSDINNACNGTYLPNNNPMAGTANTVAEHADLLTCYGVNYGDPFGGVSHGTSTAGILGAASNNGKGIATLNWNVKIMPLQALSDDGIGWTSDITAAIYYAVDNGASIINMSLGSDSDDPSLAAAIDYAYEHNVVVVAAAGNCGTGTEDGCNPGQPGAMGYPALDKHVIAVGATNVNDTRASFSSYGPGLDVVAPGYGELISPTVSRPSGSANNPTTFNYTGSYAGGLAGTSFASPYVANAISLIKSVKPSYTVDDVTALVDGTAKKLTAMSEAIYTDEYGHGLVDAAAITAVASSLSANSATPTLHQAGSATSDHHLQLGSTTTSGCSSSVATWCSIWLYNPDTGYDRYLPYAQTDTAGELGWTWSTDIVNDGAWVVRAVQGSHISPPYALSSK